MIDALDAGESRVCRLPWYTHAARGMGVGVGVVPKWMADLLQRVSGLGWVSCAETSRGERGRGRQGRRVSTDYREEGHRVGWDGANEGWGMRVIKQHHRSLRRIAFCRLPPVPFAPTPPHPHPDHNILVAIAV